MLDRLPVILFTISGVFAALGLALLLYLVLLVRHVKRLPAKDPRQDLDHMMILFQTMRDLVRSQKQLAREVNESIDKKIGIIREAVAKAAKEHEELRQARVDLSDVMRQLRDELARIQKQISMAGNAAPQRHDAFAQSIEEISLPETSRGAPYEQNPGKLADAQDEEDAIFEGWSGLGCEPAQPEEAGHHIPPPPLEQPGDAQGAREAFRKLLDLDGAPGESTDHTKPRESGSNGGNGRHKVTPLQRRVSEYADAGMSVGDIARELGIGKGEVRLILDLRRERERKG